LKRVELNWVLRLLKKTKKIVHAHSKLPRLKAHRRAPQEKMRTPKKM
jgi:hypothetical protein